MRRHLLSALLLLLVSGCTLTPDYERPALDIPESYVQPADGGASIANLEWWSLFRDPQPAWRKFFPQVNYSSGALHYHILETDYQPAVLGTMIPRASRLPLNGISFEQFDNDRWLFMTDPAHSHFKPGKTEEDYEVEAMETAAIIYPEIRGTFKAHRLFAWDEKVPTFRPGYLDALRGFWANPQEGPVYFCGDYFAGPSTGGALYTGIECSQRIVKTVEG